MTFGANQFGAVMYEESATPASTTLKGIQITINGLAVDYANNTYKRTDEIDGRGKVSFKFFDKPPDYPATLFKIGHRVSISRDDVTLFNGTVDSFKREIPRHQDPSTPDVVLYDCGAVDFSQLLDRFLVFGIFERDGVEVTIDWSGGIATCTEVGHEYTTGDTTEIFNADDGDLDGVYEVTKVNDDAYTFEAGNPFIVTPPATAEARRFFNVFDAVNRVVHDLTPLGKEGVTTGGVINDRALLIRPLLFDRKTAKQALEQIASFYDLIVFVDNDKVLHMTRSSTFLGPVGFGESPPLSNKWARLKVQTSRKDYRNVQYVGAGKAEIGKRTESFEADGEEQTYGLALEIGRRPKIEESTDAGATYNEVPAFRIGIRDKDDEQLTQPPDKKKKFVFRWFWKRADKDIHFNQNIVVASDDLDGQTFKKLSKTDIIRVTYAPLTDILTRADDVSEQNRRAAIEGGEGIYEENEDELSIEDADTAAQFGEALLRRHGRIPIRIDIRTYLDGFRAGQEIELNFPRIDVVGKFLITRLVEADMSGRDSPLSYNLQIENVERPRSLFDFWRAASKGKERKIAQQAQRKLQVLRKGSERFGVSEISVLVVAADEVEPIANDFATMALVGTARMGAMFMEEPVKVTAPVIPAEAVAGISITKPFGTVDAGMPTKPS